MIQAIGHGTCKDANLGIYVDAEPNESGELEDVVIVLPYGQLRLTPEDAFALGTQLIQGSGKA